MTADKLTDQYLGRTGMFSVPVKGAGPNGFHVPIRVIGAKRAFGRIDLEVEPEGGEGSARAKLESVTLKD